MTCFQERQSLCNTAGDGVTPAACRRDTRKESTQPELRPRFQVDLATGSDDAGHPPQEFAARQGRILLSKSISFGHQNGSARLPAFPNHAVDKKAATAPEEHDLARTNPQGMLAANQQEVTRTEPGSHAAAEDPQTHRTGGAQGLGHKLTAELLAESIHFIYGPPGSRAFDLGRRGLDLSQGLSVTTRAAMNCPSRKTSTRQSPVRERCVMWLPATGRLSTVVKEPVGVCAIANVVSND